MWGPPALVERSVVLGSGDHTLRPWRTWLLLKPVSCFGGPGKSWPPEREVFAESRGFGQLLGGSSHGLDALLKGKVLSRLLKASDHWLSLIVKNLVS